MVDSHLTTGDESKSELVVGCVLPASALHALVSADA